MAGPHRRVSKKEAQSLTVGARFRVNNGRDQNPDIPLRTAWHLLHRIRDAWEDATGTEPAPPQGTGTTVHLLLSFEVPPVLPWSPRRLSRCFGRENSRYVWCLHDQGYWRRIPQDERGSVGIETTYDHKAIRSVRRNGSCGDWMRHDPERHIATRDTPGERLVRHVAGGNLASDVPD